MGLQIKMFKALGQPLFQLAVATACPQASFWSTPRIKWAPGQAPQGDIWTSLARGEFPISQTCLLTGLAPFTCSFSLLSQSDTGKPLTLLLTSGPTAAACQAVSGAAHAPYIPYSTALSAYFLLPFSFSLPLLQFLFQWRWLSCVWCSYTWVDRKEHGWYRIDNNVCLL